MEKFNDFEGCRENPFARLNKERRDRDFDTIKQDISILDDSLKRKNAGDKDLDGQIDKVAYKMKGLIRDFCKMYPNDEVVEPLKNLVNLK